jgi:hypothetical protein
MEPNRLLKAILDVQTARVMGGAANIQEEGAVTLASFSGDSGRILDAG